MKLEIYRGTTIFNSAKFMLSKIDNSDFLVDNIIVVPDKYSLLTEKMVLKFSKGKSLFNVRVKSLSAFSNELMQKLCMGKKEIISSGESLLLTQIAIENVKKDFVAFKKNNINFCYEINKMISQFKSSCIDGASLNGDAYGVTGHKYHDLALIFNEYQRLLEGKYDANERLKLIKNNLTGKDILKNTRVYFAHYDAFTKEAFDFIKVLYSSCKSLGFAIAYPSCIGNEYIYEKDIQEKLVKMVQEQGGEIDIVISEEEMGKQSAISRGLYSYEQVQCQNDGYYNLYGAGSVNAETESIAKLIRYMTYKGFKYNDFQIAVGSVNKYQQSIEDIFDRYEIPYYIDASVTADQTILGNFVVEFLTTVVTGYGKDNLINFFSNILVKRNDLALLCQVCESEGRARYNQFIKDSDPFAEEFQKVSNSNKAKEISYIIKEVIGKVKDNYLAVLKRLQMQNDLKEYNINLQIEDAIYEVLNLIDEYSLPECDCGEYLNKLKLLLSFKQVSTVPTYLDSVMIGDATQSGFEEKPFLILMGGEELPIVSGDNGLLSDDELKLNGIGKEIEPTIRMINRRNRFKLFNLLSLGKDRLFVFYQLVNSEGKRNELPAFIKSLNTIFKQQPQNVRGVFFACDKKGDEWLLLSSGLKEKDVDFDYVNREKSINEAEKLLLENDKIKVTQLESYFVCPFRHFANYGLKLKEVIRNFDPRDLGTVCHKMAEIFVKQKVVTEEYNDCDISKFVEENLDAVLQSEGAKDKIEFLDEKESLIGFLKKQMISLLKNIVTERNKSEFVPKHIEVKFDNLKLGKYQLIGKADRIDEYKDYLRVVDYKTGKTGNLLKGLYYGEKLQLFLYQKVAGDKYNKQPGGVFYFNAKFNYSKGQEKEPILRGLVENKEEVINAIDCDIAICGKSEMTQIRKEAKGYKGSALSPYTLKSLAEYAFEVGSNAVSEIEGGYIAPKPNDDGCDWCPFGAFCQYEKQKGVRTNKDEPKF